jgi:hypothetical protein
VTEPQSTTTAESPLWREGLHIARYYLGNRWVLLALGAGVLLAGIGLNWSWLVAAGIAPILISVLPCLVMCGLGVCMLCRSGDKQSTSQPDAADASTSPAAPRVAKMVSAAGSNCCQEGPSEKQSPQVKQVQSIDERRDSHA